MTYTLDLHGLRRHEAESLLQETIDKCFYHGYTGIKVICGHGSGTLLSMTVKECESNPLIEPCGTYGAPDKGYVFIALIAQ